MTAVLRHQPLLRLFCQLISLLPAALLPLPALAADNPADGQATAASDSQSNTDASTSTSETEAQAAAPERVLPDEVRERHAAVLEYLQLFQRSDEIITLSADDQPFYGLFLQERSGQPQGGALILHAEGEHGLWPQSTGMLREVLPDYGWSTLTLQLPDPPALPVPPTSVYQPLDSAAAGQPDQAVDQTADPAATTSTAAEPPQADGEPATAQSNDPKTVAEPIKVDPVKQQQAEQTTRFELASQTYRATTVERIRQGVAYLNGQGQYNLVVIAYGNSANAAAQWLNETVRINESGKAAKGLALIMINAREDTAAKVPLNQQLGTLLIPMFDLLTEDNQLSAYQLHQRAGLMRHKNRLGYQQFQLKTPITDTDADAAMIRRIRGWLRANAAGTRVGLNR
ncbi:DUF3530 family protein [Oceanobacter mangrovi]|uniref:DUF3530 family protein n=1 Tax=Oceanobacter mangrovi TaxID=2862510 RepID=UPI001C8E270D|nr:DUF3530 family protein [Oceanobacter mangrovi]